MLVFVRVDFLSKNLDKPFIYLAFYFCSGLSITFCDHLEEFFLKCVSVRVGVCISLGSNYGQVQPFISL